MNTSSTNSDKKEWCYHCEKTTNHKTSNAIPDLRICRPCGRAWSTNWTEKQKWAKTTATAGPAGEINYEYRHVVIE